MAQITSDNGTSNSDITNPANSAVSQNMYQGEWENAFQLHTMHAQQVPNTDNLQIDPQHHAPPAAHSQQVPFNRNTITRKQKDFEPYIYRGYHDFCKWMSTDRDFYVLRQFSEASIRVALFMQHEITDLEDQLQKADDDCMKDKADNSTFKFDPHKDRRERILPMLTESIRKYHQFIINQRLLQQSGCAAHFQIQNVKNWLEDANGAIRKEEVEFIRKKRDLISVLVPDRSRFRRFLERFKIVNRFLPTQREVLEEFAPDDFERQTTHPTDSSHLDRFVFYTIVFIGVGMLIAPLWWLNYLAVHGPNLAPRLGVITGFLVAFVLLICSLTNARPFEVLAATAAYGAVLMVFMQLQQPH